MMTKQEVELGLRKTALPLAFLGLLLMQGSVINCYFVGRELGDVGLAAITLGFYIKWLLAGIRELLEVGYAVQLGRYYQKGEESKYLGGVKRYLLVSVVSGVVLCVVFWVGMPYIAEWYYHSDEVLVRYGVEYGRVMMLTLPFSYLVSGCGCIAILRGESKFVGWVSVIDFMVDVLFTGMLTPVYGMGGAAAGTVIAKVVSSVWVLRKVKSWGYLGKVEGMRWLDVAEYVFVVKKGLPVFLRELVAVVCGSYLTYYRNYYGVEVIGASYLASQIACLCYDVAEGYSRGICGYTAKYSNSESVLKDIRGVVYKDSFKLGLLVTVTLVCGVDLFARVFVGEEASVIFRWIFYAKAVPQIANSYAIMLGGYLDGLGCAKYNSNATIITYITEVVVIWVLMYFWKDVLPFDGYAAFMISGALNSFVWALMNINYARRLKVQ